MSNHVFLFYNIFSDLTIRPVHPKDLAHCLLSTGSSYGPFCAWP